jgi:hypothetical protein
MNTSTYNFHNLAGIIIESSDLEASKFFQAEYQSLEGPLPSDLNVVHLKWRRNQSLIPSAPGYTIQIHKLLARWCYRIELQEDRITIDAQGSRTAIPMVHHMLLHPSLRYLCAQSGTLKLHGSSVVVNDRSLVFTGTGGTGKTTISSLLLKYGGVNWNLHADDYTFLREGPRTYSYLTRSHFYRDHLRWIPEIKDDLSLRERIHVEVFGLIRELLRDRVKWPLRLDAVRLWPEHILAPEAMLSGVIILEKGHAHSPKLLQIEATEEVIDELLDMNFFEARHFIKLLERISEEQAFDVWLDLWKEKERGLLQRILCETTLYRLDLPNIKQGDQQFGKDLVELLSPLIEDGRN